MTDNEIIIIKELKTVLDLLNFIFTKDRNVSVTYYKIYNRYILPSGLFGFG